MMPNVVTVAPARYSQQTGTVSVQIFTGPGIFYGADVVVAGTGSAISVYDSLGAATTPLLPAATSTTATGPVGEVNIPYSAGVEVTTGLYIVMTGTVAVVNIYFRAAIP